MFIKASAMIRVSPRKLSLVAGLVRGKKVSDALMQLEFCRRRVAVDVMKCLRSAVANAENNFGFDMDVLRVKEVTVGKSVVMKRMMPRARGRSAGIKKYFSKIYIALGE